MKTSQALRHPVVLAAALLCIGWVGARIYHTIAHEWHSLEPRRHRVQPPADLAQSFHSVTVTSADQVRLACWYAPPRHHTTVIFVHGYGADRLQLYPEARFLHEHGFGAMLCDSRAHGESEGPFMSYGALEGNDLSSIADWLKAQPGGQQTQLMGLGFSMGTLALLKFAATDPRMSTMVLQAGPDSLYQFTVDEGGAFGSLTAPLKLLPLAAKGINPLALDARALLAQAKPQHLLLIHGEDDQVVPLKRMLQLFAGIAAPKSQMILPKRGHGDFFRAPDDAYAERLLAFFTAAGGL